MQVLGVLVQVLRGEVLVLGGARVVPEVRCLPVCRLEEVPGCWKEQGQGRQKKMEPELAGRKR